MVVRSNIKNAPDMKIEERYKAEKENEGGNASDEWYKTADATIAAYNTIIEKYKTVEARRKYGATKVAAWDKSQTQLLKEIAAVVVALRKEYKSNKGNFPDWNGATRAYQDEVGRMYIESGVPARHVSGLRNALYYHINNLVVAVAPKKELEALGMLTVSRRARQTRKATTPPADTQKLQEQVEKLTADLKKAEELKKKPDLKVVASEGGPIKLMERILPGVIQLEADIKEKGRAVVKTVAERKKLAKQIEDTINKLIACHDILVPRQTKEAATASALEERRIAAEKEAS